MPIPRSAPTPMRRRSELVKRFATVRPFPPLLCEMIRFGAASDGQRVLAAYVGVRDFVVPAVAR